MNWPMRSLVDQKAVEADAGIEEPHERGAVHQGEAGVAERHDIVLAGLTLDHRTFAEPAAGPDARKRHGFALARDGADLDEARNDPSP